MPTTETSDEALRSRMNSLMSGGTEIRRACGSRTRRQMSKPREAERDGGLGLAAGHRVERAAQDLRLIGGGREREAADRRHDRRHVEAEFGEEVVNEQEQHQQRDAAKDADISSAEPREPGAARQPRSADQRADHEADRNPGEGNRDGDACGLRQITERVENDLRLHRAAGSERRGRPSAQRRALRSTVRERSSAGSSSGRTIASGSCPSSRRPRP